MNAHSSRIAALAALAIAGSMPALPALAQDARAEDMTKYFQMPAIDKNKDGMVSKQEFLAMMSKAWDLQVSTFKEDRDKARDKMKLQEYQEFAKRLGLNVGS